MNMKGTSDLFELTPRDEHKIKEILGDAFVFYRDGLYLDMIVAYKHDLLVPFAHHINQVYIQRTSIPELLIESILAVAMFNCDNKYCYLYHTNELMRLGFGEEDIINLMDHFILPKHIPEKKKWEEVLKLTHFNFRRKDAFIFDATKTIRNILTKDEYVHYLQIMAMANVVFQLLVSFDKELNIDNEPKYKKVDSNEFLDHIKKIVKYIEWRDSNGIKHEFLTMCSYCKNIRTEDGEWIRFERALQTELLKPNTDFSHGICDSCFTRLSVEMGEE